MKQPIQGHPGAYKDMTTGVITFDRTHDRRKYQVAKQQSRQAINSQEEISHLKREVKELSELKGEINELKDMVRLLLENQTK